MSSFWSGVEVMELLRLAASVGVALGVVFSEDLVTGVLPAEVADDDADAGQTAAAANPFGIEDFMFMTVGLRDFLTVGVVISWVELGDVGLGVPCVLVDASCVMAEGFDVLLSVSVMQVVCSTFFRALCVSEGREASVVHSTAFMVPLCGVVGISDECRRNAFDTHKIFGKI
eukprot:comp23355_c0_seq1/m.38572 comp23355_c0_seq1/g.38572  ORF comp23355_c0_seq1/g.38572 comp23355_c0_seq1/m.38572 type:complete len:172 (+) comp23355_c0_seq1:1501-2016(+)